jgi:hypothetical protein
MSAKKIEAAIKASMAKAFFASAWADLQEEKDADDETAVNLSGREIMDVMPADIDPAAIHAANTLAMDMERTNAKPLADIYHYAIEVKEFCKGDRTLNEEFFGHYCAMQAMGHGVGLDDAFGNAVYEAIKVPYVEFGSYSLEKDY